MLRSTLIVAGATLLSSASFAQQTIDPADLHPLTVAPKYAGTYNWQTKRWMPAQRAAQLQAVTQFVYDNTCTFTGGGFVTAQAQCSTYFDEGRIPGGIGGSAPVGATSDNLITYFEFSYCTTFVTGTVDMKVGFYDNLGGGCVGGLSPNPPPLSTTAQGYFDFGAAAGFPLPGAATAGTLTCPIVGVNFGNAGFCMQSDGDGIFDNNLNLDQFSWSLDMDNPSLGTFPTNYQGPILSGEPLSSGVGGCTYSVPCGTDFLYGNPCGHGLDTEDLWWVNTDKDRAGTPTTFSCPSSLPTGCYWFGGYPGGVGFNNPFSSFYMKIGSAGSCAGCNGSPTTYCTSGTTTAGCSATISLTGGTPNAGFVGPCNVTVVNTTDQENGIIFYGLVPLGNPWGFSSSFLCVKSPLERTGVQNGGGTGIACDGVLSIDLNAYWAASPGAVGQPITAGLVVFVQGWFRDPPASKTTTAMSNALQLTVCP